MANLGTMLANERRRLIQEIEGETGRTLLCYVSRESIDHREAYDLDRAIDEVRPDGPITLLLQSRGGDADAAEKIVHVLRQACSPRAADGSPGLEVVVPDRAKSAATLIALGADRILMSDSSELGPIDPQYGGVSVAAVLQEYKAAEQRYAKQPNNKALAAAFSKFDPLLIAAMQQAMLRARRCAENLLKRQGGNYTAAPEALLDIDRFPSHSQMIDWRIAREIGIPHVHYLRRDDRLWQQYRRLYQHLTAILVDDGRVIESRTCSFIV